MNILETVKSHHRIETVAAMLCGGLRSSGRGGRYFLGHCPSCELGQSKRTKRGLMWVDTSKQICNCFKCGKGRKPMDVINLWAWHHGLDNDWAIADLYASAMLGKRAKTL